MIKLLKGTDLQQNILKDVFTKNTLANRYKQDVIESFDIDEEALKLD